MDITQQAADWFCRHREQNLSRDESRRFSEWLAQSPRHVQEYLAVTATWGTLDAKASWPDDSTDELLAALRPARGTNVLAFNSGGTDHDRVGRAPFFRRHPITRRAAAAVGAACLCAGMAYQWLLAPHVYRTARGEQQSIVLDDGTIVQINTLSRLEVHFEKSARRVTLTQGEAYFRVAHDTSRPFIVATPYAHIRAVGTEFDVYNHDERTNVAVIEGKVAVDRADIPRDTAPGDSPPSDRIEPPIPVSAGQQLSVTAEHQPLALKAIDATNPIAWIQRRIVLDGATISEALTQFNRYNAAQMTVRDPSLAQLKITGVFNADEPGALLSYLQDVLHARITREHGQIDIDR